MVYHAPWGRAKDRVKVIQGLGTVAGHSKSSEHSLLLHLLFIILASPIQFTLPLRSSLMT